MHSTAYPCLFCTNEERACRTSLPSCDRAFLRNVEKSRSLWALLWAINDSVFMRSAKCGKRIPPANVFFFDTTVSRVERHFIVRSQLVVLKLNDECVMMFICHEVKANSQFTNGWWAPRPPSRQYVVYNEVRPNNKPVVCGIPQGSILGPMLFLLYINGLANISKKLKFILFADDTKTDTCRTLKSGDVLSATETQWVQSASYYFIQVKAFSLMQKF